MVKVAQIGAGYWGKNLVRNFAELSALAAIVEPNQEQAESLSKEYGVPLKTLNEVLSNENINGVSIATPAETHVKFALEAIAAGKHVYVEKPLALSIEGAESITKAAKEAGVCVMVGHLLQYHPIFMQALKMVKDGVCGNIKQIYSNRLSFGKFRIEENAWWSFAPHDLSMVLALAGEEPISVSTQGASYVTPGLADWVTAQLKFPNGLNANFTVSWMHPFKEQRLTIIGDDGMLVFEDSEPDWEKKLAYYKHSIIVNNGEEPKVEKAEVEYISVDQGEPLRNECSHFLECIADGSKPRTDGNEGVRVLKVLQEGEACLAEYLKK